MTWSASLSDDYGLSKTLWTSLVRFGFSYAYESSPLHRNVGEVAYMPRRIERKQRACRVNNQTIAMTQQNLTEQQTYRYNYILKNDF
jgi:hypothetical protein